MRDCIFHASLAAVYATLALEAWRINHRRFACCYGLAACLSLRFATMLLHWTEGATAMLWA